MSDSIAQSYGKTMHKQFQYFASWPLNRKIEPGMVGILDNNIFTPTRHLRDFKIDFTLFPSESQADYEFQSSGGVNIKAEGDASVAGIAEGDAGFVVNFEDEKSVLFRLAEATLSSIENLGEVGDKIMELYEKGQWNKKWFVVTEVVNGGTGSIVLSDKKNASIGIQAKVKGDSSLGLQNLSGANANLSIKSTSNIESKMVGAKDLSPLFKLGGIKKHFFGPDGFIIKSEGSVSVSDAEEKDAFSSEVTPDDGK